MKRKEVVLNLGLVLASVLVVLAGIEAALWSGALQDDRTQCEGLNRAVNFHPSYGWTKPPNSQFVRHYGPNPSELFTINEQGFHDTYDIGDRTVIVLGDSFTYGVLVGDNGTYSYWLDEWHGNISFENYGMNGYSTAQELNVYRDVGAEHYHEVVILGFTSNDPADNIGGDTRRPRFSIEDGEVRLRQEPETNPTIEMMKNFAAHTRSVPFLYRRSGIAAANIKTLFFNPSKTQPNEPVQNLALTEALIKEIGREASRNEAELVILYHTPRAVAHEAGSATDERQLNMLKNITNEMENVYLVDPTRALRSEVSAGRQVYGIEDGHFEDYGHLVVAGELALWFENRGYIESTGGRMNDLNKSQNPEQCP